VTSALRAPRMSRRTPRSRWAASSTAIWSECGFGSPEQAADLFHAAYPHLEWDDYLVDEIRAIGERGSGSLDHPIW